MDPLPQTLPNSKLLRIKPGLTCNILKKQKNRKKDKNKGLHQPFIFREGLSLIIHG